jgi:hypothetical protein
MINSSLKIKTISYMDYSYIKDIELESNKSLDESSDNANILNDSLFEECFKKIL